MSNKYFLTKIYDSLKRIWAIVTSSALGTIRTGPALFFTFIYPIIMILLFGYIFGAGTTASHYDLYYYNNDTYQIGDELLSYSPAQDLLESLGLNNQTISDELNIRLREASINFENESVEEWMKTNNIPYMIVIPEGWSATVNLSKINPLAPIANISYYYDPSYTSSFEINNILNNVLQKMNLELFSIPTTIQITIQNTPSTENLDYIDFYVPGVIMITISTSGMMGMVAYATDGRQSGLIFKLSATPMKKWEWALAHEIWQVFMGIIVAILTIATGYIAFGFHLSMLHPIMIPIIIFGTMTFAGLALIISRFVKRPEAAMAATMSFVFPQMFLSGAIFPSSMMPQFLLIIAKFFPLNYIVEAMRASMLDTTFNQVWVPLGITIAMGIVFFTIGAMITIWRKD
ncbi:MAG: ABC transporter permease [Candidatus Thorarchaeota archaeon]